MSVEIRTYEIQQDGSLEPHSILPISYYHGICPQVGDTLCNDLMPEAPPIFYEVMRRYFFNTVGAFGWALVICRREASDDRSRVYEAWIDDTDFWNGVDEREETERSSALRG
ncbi:hypothetical protein [Ensifer canadensis]|uniref:hypothetical protein n=1 Tax=Ensifer canadensis TaxID=555315 RepID=UPI00193FA4C9|nr:hypothetical protein [Ensifer canadensis]